MKALELEWPIGETRAGSTAGVLWLSFHMWACFAIGAYYSDLGFRN